ncbi:hypothetical protein J2T17_006325 [Paenibacillus mucilaginosus]
MIFVIGLLTFGLFQLLMPKQVWSIRQAVLFLTKSGYRISEMSKSVIAVYRYLGAFYVLLGLLILLIIAE